MADGFTPVGNLVQPPQPMSLADVMNIARGAQAYQQSQQYNPIALDIARSQATSAQLAADQAARMNPISLDIARSQAQSAQQAATTGQINLDKLSQANKERLGLQDFFQNPDNWQTNGQLDMSKVNSAVPKIAPLTGPDYLEKISKVSSAQTDAVQAMQNLDQSDRLMISSRLGVIGRLGVKEKDAYTSELDNLVKENPGNKNLEKVVNAYKSLLSYMPEKSDAFPQIAIRSGQAMLDVGKQEELFGAKPGTISTGAATYQTQTQQLPGGMPPKITVSPQPLATTQITPNNRYVPTGRTDINNRPTFMVYGPDGTLYGEMAAPEYQGQGQIPTEGGPVAKPGTVPAPVGGGSLSAIRIPPGESPETGQALQAERTQANNNAKNVPAIRDTINQVVDLASKINQGQLGQAEQEIASRFGFVFGKDNASNLQQLGHFQAVLAQSLYQQMGMQKTDAGAAQAEVLAGKPNWTADAIKSSANTIGAYNTGVGLYNTAMENYLANHQSQGIYAKRDFNKAWTNNFNVDAMRLYNAADPQLGGGKMEIDKVIRELGGSNSPRYLSAMQSLRSLQTLVKQGKLPGEAR